MPEEVFPARRLGFFLIHSPGSPQVWQFREAPVPTVHRGPGGQREEGRKERWLGHWTDHLMAGPDILSS